MAEPAKPRRARAKTDTTSTSRPRTSTPRTSTMAEAEAAAHDAPEIRDEPPAHTHEGETCPVAWCPICMAVTAVQPLRPDVIEHLLKAGTELLLAFRSVLDTRADDLAGAPEDEGPGPTRFEKIDLG